MPGSDTTPLLWDFAQQRTRSQDRLPYYRQDERREPLSHKDVAGNDPHAQFCALTGCPPSSLGPKDKFQVTKKSLYGRTVSQLSSQRRAYNFSASLNNILLLSQVILGATLTALGASASSHILITIFGVMNTIIAGLVAYLKSRGQPMRARMYRDDLERIVDEIENSEVMWRGISTKVHGYDEIDTDEVTVRSEVARLTRLYERAIRLNGMNNPDMYMAGAGGFDANSGGGVRPSRAGPSAGPQNLALPAIAATAPQPSGENVGPAVPVVPNPEDEAPATKVKVDDKKDDKDKDPDNKQEEESKSDGKKPATDGASDEPSQSAEPSMKAATDAQPSPPTDVPLPVAEPRQRTAPLAVQALLSTPSATAPASASIQASDPDASPATAAHLKPKRTQSGRPREGGVDSKKVSGDEDH